MFFVSYNNINADFIAAELTSTSHTISSTLSKLKIFSIITNYSLHSNVVIFCCRGWWCTGGTSWKLNNIVNMWSGSRLLNIIIVEGVQSFIFSFLCVYIGWYNTQSQLSTCVIK